MNFEDELKNSCFLLQLQSNTKEGIIAEMVDALFSAGRIKNREGTVRAVLEREKKMSTGMQHGIAVPHGKTDAVDRLVTALALKKEGVDFNAMDGQPSRIFIMTISPVNRTGPHMQYLAEISRLLSCPAVRDQLLLAQTPEEAIRVLTE